MNMLNRDLGMGDLCDNIGLVGVSAIGNEAYTTLHIMHDSFFVPFSGGNFVVSFRYYSRCHF